MARRERLRWHRTRTAGDHFAANRARMHSINVLVRRHGTEAAFSALLDTAAPGFVPRVRAAQIAGRVHGWAGVRGFFRRSHGPGWALVGDAGYYKDPITPHGMTDAMRDAELLSMALLNALSGGVQERLALAGYQATRDALSHRLFDATEEVAAYDWDPTRIQALLRQVSSAMSDEVDYLTALPSRTLGADSADGWMPIPGVSVGSRERAVSWRYHQAARAFEVSRDNLEAYPGTKTVDEPAVIVTAAEPRGMGKL
jgi:hypothetical protein